MSSLKIENWGLIAYQKALEQQLELVNEISESPDTGYIVFCKHPEVVTLGRATQKEDVFAWDGDLIEVSRGGRATYHGPSQLVIYPILSLKKNRQHIPPQDVVAYLRVLENSIIEFLELYGINAIGRSLQKRTQKEAEETGVWIGSQKIASLGIAVKKWVTYHGAAINIYNDPKAYRGMNPCGFNRTVMTSLEQQISSTTSDFPKALTEEEIVEQLKTVLLKNFT